MNYNITLDLQKANTQYIINAIKGDVGNSIVATFSVEGESDVLSGKTVKFVGLKPDNTLIYGATTISGDTATYTDTTGQLCAAKGIVICSFIVMEGTVVKSAPQFFVVVNTNVDTTRDVVESSDDLSALNVLIGQLEYDLANDVFKGPKGDKGDPGDTLAEISNFNLATDPKTIYKVSISGGNQYFVFVIRSASAITQWRFTPKDIAQGQAADISIRTGTISTAGIITWEDHWTRLFDFLELVDESTAADMIAAAAYSKAQVNTLINDLNTAKANKSEVYTRTQVDNLISAVSTLSFEVVQALPTTDIKTNVIYLLPKQTPATGNIYEEWAYINNNWELLGTTDIDISGKADKATTLAGYGITDAYTKADVNGLVNDLNTAKVNKTQKIAGIALSDDIQKSSLVSAIHDAINPYVTSGVSGYDGQYGVNSSYNPVYCPHGGTSWTELAKASDLSGKVDKTQKIAGIALSGDISKDDLVDNIHSKINPANVVSGQTNGYLGQYGSTADKKPMFYTGMSEWAELAKASDIPDVSGKADKATTLAGYGITDAYTKTEVNTALSGKADTADIPELINDLLDGATAMRQKVSLDSPPPDDEMPAAQVLALPCIWYYNGDAWLIYGTEPGETAGYRKYKMIQFATDDDLPDLTTKEDKSNKVEQVQDSSSTTQYPSIKAMTTYVTLGLSYKEATANRVTSINSSSDNSHYPTAKAVKDYVDTVIGGIENGSY